MRKGINGRLENEQDYQNTTDNPAVISVIITIEEHNTYYISALIICQQFFAVFGELFV
jgi:hypothetical protein